MEERLQKILSRAGYGSRRTCEELIAKGAAYPCFCTRERLEELREQQKAAKSALLGYDGPVTPEPPTLVGLLTFLVRWTKSIKCGPQLLAGSGYPNAAGGPPVPTACSGAPPPPSAAPRPDGRRATPLDNSTHARTRATTAPATLQR